MVSCYSLCLTWLLTAFNIPSLLDTFSTLLLGHYILSFSPTLLVVPYRCPFVDFFFSLLSEKLSSSLLTYLVYCQFPIYFLSAPKPPFIACSAIMELDSRHFSCTADTMFSFANSVGGGGFPSWFWCVSIRFLTHGYHVHVRDIQQHFMDPGRVLSASPVAVDQHRPREPSKLCCPVSHSHTFSSEAQVPALGKDLSSKFVPQVLSLSPRIFFSILISLLELILATQ